MSDGCPSTEMGSRAEHPVVRFGADRALCFFRSVPGGRAVRAAKFLAQTLRRKGKHTLDWILNVRGPGPASQFLIISTKKLGENPALLFLRAGF